MERKNIKITIYLTPSQYSTLQKNMQELKYDRPAEYFRDLIEEGKKPTKAELKMIEQKIEILEGLSALNTLFEKTIELLYDDDNIHAFKESIENILTKIETLINKHLK